MIKEVLVVEGKMDVVAIDKAVEADCIITGGFSLKKSTMNSIEQAYRKRGIIIMTDPDMAGERIRTYLTRRFPEAKHAFVPVDEATDHDDIGIEQASPESIRKALEVLHIESLESSYEFTSQDMVRYELSGFPNSVANRARVGAALGIGYGNGKQFLYRLNHYGITREAFTKAVEFIQEA